MKPSNMFGLNPASHSSPNLIAAIRPLPRRAQTAPPKAITGRSSGRPDYVLTFCYMLVYLEALKHLSLRELLGKRSLISPIKRCTR
ncbi:hypothetical protein V2G26_017470 [Clonostachys chloroleuca]